MLQLFTRPGKCDKCQWGMKGLMTSGPQFCLQMFTRCTDFFLVPLLGRSHVLTSGTNVTVFKSWICSPLGWGCPLGQVYLVAPCFWKFQLLQFLGPVRPLRGAPRPRLEYFWAWSKLSLNPRRNWWINNIAASWTLANLYKVACLTIVRAGLCLTGFDLIPFRVERNWWINWGRIKL